MSDERDLLKRDAAWALGLLAPVAAIVLSRSYDHALFRGSSYGADWVEHTERLRALVRWRSGGEPLGGFLLSLDTVYPPGQMVWGLLSGSVFGHSAEAVLRAGQLWTLAVVVATGLMAARLGGRRAGLAAAVVCAGLPGLPAAGYVFHSDLPVFALLWLATAALVLFQDRRPLLAGSLAAVLVVAAALFKWSAGLWVVALLPLVWLAPGGGVRRSWPRRVLAMGVLALLVGGAIDQYLRLSVDSLVELAHLTYRRRPDLQPEGLLVALRALADVADQVRSEQTPGLGPQVVWKLPFRLVAAALSPLLTPLLAVGILVAAGARRPGLLFALTFGAVGVLVVPRVLGMTEDRYALVAIGPLALVAGLAWSALPVRAARVAAVGWTIAASWVAWDFHHAGRDQPDPASVGLALGLDDSFTWRGLGADSSDNEKGWKHERPASHSVFLPGKDAAWAASRACGVGRIDVRGAVGVDESPWFEYRALLDSLEGPGPSLVMGGGTVVVDGPEEPRVVWTVRPADSGIHSDPPHIRLSGRGLRCDPPWPDDATWP